MPDASQPPLDAAHALLAALQRLHGRPLPGETRAVIGEVEQALHRWTKDLEAGPENARLAALARVSNLVGASLDLDEVLTGVMDAVIRLTGAERGFLVLAGTGDEGWQVRAARNFSQEDLPAGETSFSRTVVENVLRSGEGVVTTDARSDPRFANQESVLLFDLRSILCAPLLARGQVLGAIYVDHRVQVGLFSEGDLDLLQAFAAHAAIAIDNARLYTQAGQALARRVSELELLASLDQELDATLELAHVLEIAHRGLLSAARSERAWVLLSSEDGGEETLNEAANPWAGIYPAADPSAPPVQDPLCMAAVAARAPQAECSPAGQSRLAAPLVQAGRIHGLVVLERSAPFSPAEIQFLSQVVRRVTAALVNARLYLAVQEANQAKSRFVSVVTHELRLPMTSIRGYTDLLRQGVVGPVNPQQLQFLEVIHNNVERMSALVSDLSDISRIETGRLKLECKQLSLGAAIEEAVSALRPRLDEKKQILEAALPPDLPQVFADPNRVIQILNNLLSNAWKYTPAGGRVFVTAEEQPGCVRVAVTDTGIGISPEDQAHLFAQFFRSEDPAVREQQGWGLGLNVTRRLVELMGGKIGVFSAPAQGSTFWFTLPLSS